VRAPRAASSGPVLHGFSSERRESLGIAGPLADVSEAARSPADSCQESWSHAGNSARPDALDVEHFPPQDVAHVLDSARRMLETGGLVGLVSLTPGTHGLPRAISDTWTRIWKTAPALVGGCHPINLAPCLEAAGFRIMDHDVVTSWGVTSEVATAQPD